MPLRTFLGMPTHRLPSTTALVCFEASARLGSFTRAALELHLTQAGVSRQVIGLERRLDVRLFERRREALQLTEAGRALLEEVRPALRQLERATASVTSLKGRGGVLSLSVASSLGSHWLIPRLPAFTQAHPEITLNFATRVGPAEFFGQGIDASLEFSDGQRPGMRSDFVLPLDLQPCASPDWVRRHGRSLGAGTPSTALIHHTTVPEAWGGWFAVAARPLPVGPQGPRHDLMTMALQAALAGLGVALLPRFMADDAVARRRLVRLSAVAWRASRGYWLVRPAAESDRPALAAFRDWLLAEAGPT